MAIIIAKDNTVFNCDNVASITSDGNKVVVQYDQNGGPARELSFEKSASLEAAIIAAKLAGDSVKAEFLAKEGETSILPATAAAIAAGNGAGGTVQIISTMVLQAVGEVA